MVEQARRPEDACQEWPYGIVSGMCVSEAYSSNLQKSAFREAWHKFIFYDLSFVSRVVSELSCGVRMYGGGEMCFTRWLTEGIKTATGKS